MKWKVAKKQLKIQISRSYNKIHTAITEQQTN